MFGAISGKPYASSAMTQDSHFTTRLANDAATLTDLAADLIEARTYKVITR